MHTVHIVHTLRPGRSGGKGLGQHSGVTRKINRNRHEIQFPFSFERHGRIGKIKFWPKSGLYGTYFQFAGNPVRNSFNTFEAAYLYLDTEFAKLDQDPLNSRTIFPIHSDVKNYHELEQLLSERTGGASTLREAVNFFLAHHDSNQFKPKKVSECITSFHEAGVRRKVSPGYAKTSTIRLRKFAACFGTREIHTIRATEIEEWLSPLKSPKTSNHYRGIVVSLFLYARDVLQAIPDEGGKVAPQRVQPSKVDRQTKVEIYSPEQITTILNACVQYDCALIPVVVLGCFLGLRPNEIHGEEARYAPLSWESIDWERGEIHVEGQKVRGLNVRDLKIPDNAMKWLLPFRKCKGIIWTREKSYNRRLKKLINNKAAQTVVYDGFRHSYASYRIRQLNGDLNKLAEEMGNSPSEIINSYKRNVRDEDVIRWHRVLSDSVATRYAEFAYGCP